MHSLFQHYSNLRSNILNIQYYRGGFLTIFCDQLSKIVFGNLEVRLHRFIDEMEKNDIIIIFNEAR